MPDWLYLVKSCRGSLGLDFQGEAEIAAELCPAIPLKSYVRGAPCAFAGLESILKDGFDILARVEGQEILNLFADADELNRQAEFAGDGDDDATLGGAVELGENNAGRAGALGELARLLEAVLPGRGVNNQQHLMGRPRHFAAGDAAHLVELGHQVVFGVEPSGGVDDDEIVVALLGGSQRVENDGGRIGAGFLHDDLNPQASRPDFQLLVRCRPKGVGCTKQGAAALLTEVVRKLGDGRRLADSVHADDEDDLRLAGRRCSRRRG